MIKTSQKLNQLLTEIVQLNPDNYEDHFYDDFIIYSGQGPFDTDSGQIYEAFERGLDYYERTAGRYDIFGVSCTECTIFIVGVEHGIENVLIDIIEEIKKETNNEISS